MQRTSRNIIALLSLLGSSFAWSQIVPPSISYTVGSTPVPTLSSQTLLALSALLVITALSILKRKSTLTTVAIGLMVTGVSAGLVDYARAINGGQATIVVQLSNTSGETLTLTPSTYDNTWQVANTLTSPITISSISTGNDCALPSVNSGVALTLPPGAQLTGTCTTGDVLNPNEYCELRMFCGPI